MALIFSRKMPTTVQNSSDRNLNFSLGRNYYTRVASNESKIIDYSKCSNTSSIGCGKPIKQNDSSMRTQALRLKNIGTGSMNLKDSEDYFNYYGNRYDINHINSRLQKVRGGGSIAPKKYNYYKK